MPVTSYLDISETGLVAGQFYKSIVNGAKLTGYNTGNTVLPAGFGACWAGTADKAVIVPSADTHTRFAGVLTIPTVEVRAGYSLDGDGRFGYPAKYEVALAITDCYAVFVDATVEVGQPVHLNIAESTSVPGTFRGVANSTDSIAIPNARFLSAAVGTPSDLALAVINLSAQ